MSDDEDFLAWLRTTWHEAEVALHDGDAGPRFEIWSDREPVTLFGAWRNAVGPDQAREVFRLLETGFSDVVRSDLELTAYGVSGDLAYTVGREHTETSVDGEPRQYVLRVTQVYRREGSEWKVVHRHADADPTGGDES
jgi:ketosteroid isomerase-like protein